MKISKVPCPCGYKGPDGRGKCSKFILPPLINTSEASLSSEEADEVIGIFRDAERFRWALKNMTRAASARFLPAEKRLTFIDSLIARDKANEQDSG